MTREASDHDINTAAVVIETGKVLSEMLCCQAYLVLILDEHMGTMPAIENVLKRPPLERQRFADVLRMWAARIEKGAAPEARKA